MTAISAHDVLLPCSSILSLTMQSTSAMHLLHIYMYCCFIVQIHRQSPLTPLTYDVHSATNQLQDDHIHGVQVFLHVPQLQAYFLGGGHMHKLCPRQTSPDKPGNCLSCELVSYNHLSRSITLNCGWHRLLDDSIVVYRVCCTAAISRCMLHFWL